VAVRKAIAGRDALVAQGGFLELERLCRRAELQVRRAVEPGADVLQILVDVPERERQGTILSRHPGTPCPQRPRSQRLKATEVATGLLGGVDLAAETDHALDDVRAEAAAVDERPAESRSCESFEVRAWCGKPPTDALDRSGSDGACPRLTGSSPMPEEAVTENAVFALGVPVVQGVRFPASGEPGLLPLPSAGR
jgi:hypothetical protein